MIISATSLSSFFDFLENFVNDIYVPIYTYLDNKRIRSRCRNDAEL